MNPSISYHGIERIKKKGSSLIKLMFLKHEDG